MDEQPDLLDIPTYYEKDGGAFWLAAEDCTVIGTLALMNKGNGNGVLKKGFVNKSFRKRGILTELYEKSEIIFLSFFCFRKSFS